MAEADFGGRRVVSFESRRAVEMASLIERHGGVAVSATSVREIPPVDPDAGGAAGARHSQDAGSWPACSPLEFVEQLRAGAVDAVVLMTGVGTRGLAEAVAPVMRGEDLAAALSRTQVIARGPKPAVALRELGVTGFTTAAEPSRWQEVQSGLIAAGPLAGRRIAVQEYGIPSVELYRSLAQKGAIVRPISVYRWALPEDMAPLRRALVALSEGEAKIALFTSRVQVEHVFLVAEQDKLGLQLRQQLARGVVAAIGPVCAEALRMEGVTPDIIPEHARMGQLVKAAAVRAAEVLRGKNSE